jgi:hypothetical protein
MIAKYSALAIVDASLKLSLENVHAALLETVVNERKIYWTEQNVLDNFIFEFPSQFCRLLKVAQTIEYEVEE